MCLPPLWIQLGVENRTFTAQTDDSSNVTWDQSDNSTNSVTSTTNSISTEYEYREDDFGEIDAITRRLHHSRISGNLIQTDIRRFLSRFRTSRSEET